MKKEYYVMAAAFFLVIFLGLILLLYANGYFSLTTQPWSIILECPSQVKIHSDSNKEIIVCVKCKNIGADSVSRGHMTFSGRIDNNTTYNGKLPGDIFDPGSETIVNIPMRITDLSVGKHTITVSICQNAFITIPVNQRTFSAQHEFTVIE